MNPKSVYEMEDLVESLQCIARKLAAQVPPGHVDYISKSDASKWLMGIVEELRQ